MEEYAREPCPWRIVDDCGGAFTMGALGGGIFQAVKGFRNSPSGMNHRLRGSLTAIRTRAPQLGGMNTLYTPAFLSPLSNPPFREQFFSMKQHS
ncbi:hypothetical protein PDJAM_G00118050 [Pangasius djambal]|uniref:Uncharacterized protein n=1 Tax=Pangasius djambal TaxID=1691987 RepID=A0ACC5Z8F8_9TELE|nr:hypothetical protein [Pangasius djambal]